MAWHTKTKKEKELELWHNKLMSELNHYYGEHVLPEVRKQAFQDFSSIVTGKMIFIWVQ